MFLTFICPILIAISGMVLAVMTIAKLSECNCCDKVPKFKPIYFLIPIVPLFFCVVLVTYSCNTYLSKNINNCEVVMIRNSGNNILSVIKLPDGKNVEVSGLIVDAKTVDLIETHYLMSDTKIYTFNTGVK